MNRPNRRLMPAASLGSGVAFGLARVTQPDPMYVKFQGREVGPVLLTSVVAAIGLAVGDQVLVAALEDDPDQFVAIDGMST